MLLAVDVGNTNIKMGLFDGGTLAESLRIAANVNKTSDEYGMGVVDMLKNKGVKAQSVDGVVMSSVTPALNYTVSRMLRYYFKREPLIVSCALDCGIKIKYDNPRELGADRIAGSAAAYKRYGGPCVVVDFGTATTFNVVDADGVFLGGAICPGIKTGAEALSAIAAKLPHIELALPPRVVGTNTVTNMQSGVLYGFVGIVEYMVKKIKDETGFKRAKVIATGGLSELIAKESVSIDAVNRALTLEGLNLIYNLNVKKQGER